MPLELPLELKEWIGQVFGQARDEICGPNQATLVRLTEVFENASTLLAPCSDEALNRAFWSLSASGFHALKNEAIAWSLRGRLIRSFETLFRELFAVRCQAALGHSSEEGGPLNTACYMWWDFDCWVAAPVPLDRNPMDSAFLASMRSILEIDHVACRESALHGLGHWHRAHPSEVENIVDEFVNRERYLPSRLREYAASARCGCVL